MVITVPAYFGEQQKKLTRQAAEMLNLEVLTIINEPTAAALAYGFTNDKIANEKILVFDLGGGTFDVSILSVHKEENTDFTTLEVLSTSGDMHLGGEDFDNALANYIIKKLNNEKIRENKQCMKRLKIACENAKKILSDSDQTILRLSNFYNNIDIDEKITKKDFEDICDPLFKRLEEPLKIALSNAKLTKNEINQVILIGGSTRIPKVKQIIESFFPQLKKKNINDSINPDETVAYGATLQAQKKLYIQDEAISKFNILDIAPFSLGVSVKNNSKDKDIQKEGDEMSVIIKRGTKLPTSNVQKYETVRDNQTEVLLKIYEGEKKYVKYNHLIKETTIEGLSPKPKGETKISVEFKIDPNGILFVKAIEDSEKKGKVINLTIKNDEVSFSNEEMEKLKNKMEEMTKKINRIGIDENNDYTNLKENLKTYKEAYNECKDDEEQEENQKLFLSNFNETLEEFIDKFDKTYDNETILEKLYLYVKELFLSYIEYFKLGLDAGVKKSTIKKIEKYLGKFIEQSSGYLNKLLDIISNINEKNIFYEIIIHVMEKLNDCGIKCIKTNKKFCKYNSLMYFEQSLSYYEKYLSNLKDAVFKPESLNLLKNQKSISLDYIKKITTGSIVLTEQSLLEGRKFDETKNTFSSLGTGITYDLNKLGISIESLRKNEQNLNNNLRDYENLLSELQTTNKETEEEAKCIYYILEIYKITNRLIDKKMYLLGLADRCDLIIRSLRIDTKQIWCKEFYVVYEELRGMQSKKEDYYRLFEGVRKKNPEMFDRLDNEFNKKGGTIEFIDFLLEKYPYPEYESDKKKKDFKTYNNGLLTLLMSRYQPKPYSETKEESVKKYCLYTEISDKISRLLRRFQ